MKLYETKEINLFDVPEIAEELKKSPKEYDGTISLLRWKHINSLKHSPATINGSFDCSYTQILTLEGGPHKVLNNFDCSHTKIISLRGAPSFVGRNFECVDCNDLETVEGAPLYVGNYFIGEIMSLHNIHKRVKYIGNEFVSPMLIPKNILGLLLIVGLKAIDIDTPINKIMNKHLRTKDVFKCQDELIEAGYVEQAKL